MKRLSLDSRLLRRRARSAARKLSTRLQEQMSPFNASPWVFDTSFWTWLEPIGSEETAWLHTGLPPQRNRPWPSAIPKEEVESEAAQCFEDLGFWPISFSFPSPRAASFDQKDCLLSSIRPGEPYSFTSSRTYYEEYRKAQYGLTFRKAGWDCFRHVEIIASGAIPVMPDINLVPRFSMVHYPKRMMSEVVNHLRSSGDAPSQELAFAFRQHYERHLSTASMAKYILGCSDLHAARKILFVDGRLPLYPDYQSLLSLIGFKQVLGPNCVAVPEVPYLYTDWQGQAASLYGRGFGFSHVLSPDAQSKKIRSSKVRIRKMLRKHDFDALVVGSIARNGPLASDLLEWFPPSRTVWIHGEDAPPSPREQHFLREAGVHVFIRSMPAANGGLPASTASNVSKPMQGFQ